MTTVSKRLLVIAGVLLIPTILSSISPEEYGTFVPMRYEGAAAFYVTTQINGLGAVDFMVDTGSTYTIINEQTLAILMEKQCADYVRDLEGILADGSRVVLPLYSIHGMNIGGQCPVQNIEVAVMPGKTRQILGLNALRRASPFIFSMNPPQLVLSNCMSSFAGV